MKATEYVFERITKEKLPDFYQLFLTRGKNFPFSYFVKKYDTKWTGKEFIGVIVYDADHNPVGYLGSLPMFVMCEEKRILCCQISDAVIHPNHQKKGLFAKIIEVLLTIAKEEGIEFLFVFPSPQAYSGFDKSGWAEVDHLKNYTFSTRCFPLNKIANKFNLLKLFNLYIKVVLSLISKSDRSSFSSSVIDQHTGGVIKDNNFISHKTYSYNYIIRFMGFKIWWKIDDGLSVGDIERFEPVRLTKLFKALKILCFVLGFHNFKIITSSGTYIDDLLNNTYAHDKGNKVYFIDISSGIEFSKIKFMQSEINTF